MEGLKNMKNRLQLVFDKQKELMEKYHDIEVANGLVQTEDVPVEINSREGQARLRDFAWRFVEELGEAMDAYFVLQGELHPDVEEEFVDALHFLTEFTILAGVESHEVIRTSPYDLDNFTTLADEALKLFLKFETMNPRGCISDLFTHTITKIAMTINTLKNKAWKQSERDTDLELFHIRLRETWVLYFALMLSVGMYLEDVPALYLDKNAKNKKRQKAGY